MKRRIARLLAVSLFGLSAVVGYPGSASAADKSNTQTLNYGVVCTEYVTYIINSTSLATLHHIACNQTVEYIRVNGYMWKTGYKQDPAYNDAQYAICTNTSSCSVVADVMPPNYVITGYWETKTSGQVGKPTNANYYGVMADMFHKQYIY